MAKHLNSNSGTSKQDALLSLERDATQLVVTMIQERMEKSTIKHFPEFLMAKAGQHVVKTVAGAEHTQRGRILVHFNDPEILAHISKCRRCKGRGYASWEVSYKKDAKGKYIRDDNGDPIELSREMNLCQCVTNNVVALSETNLTGKALREYEKQTKQADNQAPIEDKPAPKKRATKAKAADVNSEQPKKVKSKRPAPAKES